MFTWETTAHILLHMPTNKKQSWVGNAIKPVGSIILLPGTFALGSKEYYGFTGNYIKCS